VQEAHMGSQGQTGTRLMEEFAPGLLFRATYAD
jgi:hypothetical protein